MLECLETTHLLWSLTQLFLLNVGWGGGSWQAEKTTKGLLFKQHRSGAVCVKAGLLHSLKGLSSGCHSVQTNRPTQKTNSRLCLGEKGTIPCIWNSETKPLRDFTVFYEKQREAQSTAWEVHPCPSLSRVQLQPADNVTCAESAKLGAFRRISSEEPKETGRWWKTWVTLQGRWKAGNLVSARGRLGYFLKWHMESEAVLREENSTGVTGRITHKFLCHASHGSFGTRLKLQPGWRQILLSVSGWRSHCGSFAAHVQRKQRASQGQRSRGWLRRQRFSGKKLIGRCPGANDSSLLTPAKQKRTGSTQQLQQSHTPLKSSECPYLTVSLMHKYQVSISTL